MALTITDECINCDVCEPVCPNEAISLGAEHYVIDPDRCTECIGHFDEPQCASLCPVACIPVDPTRVETKETLWHRYRRLQAEKGQPLPVDAPGGGGAEAAGAPAASPAD